mgnify:CR=1 FL=1
MIIYRVFIERSTLAVTLDASATVPPWQAAGAGLGASEGGFRCDIFRTAKS